MDRKERLIDDEEHGIIQEFVCHDLKGNEYKAYGYDCRYDDYRDKFRGYIELLQCNARKPIIVEFHEPNKELAPNPYPVPSKHIRYAFEYKDYWDLMEDGRMQQILKFTYYTSLYRDNINVLEMTLPLNEQEYEVITNALHHLNEEKKKHGGLL